MQTRATCVIVDDHEAVRDGTRTRLDQLDWLDVVGEASPVDEAVSTIRSLRPALALVDVRLPDGSGLDVVAAVDRESLPTRTVLYSGVATTTQAEHALDAGVAGFVLKDSPLSSVVDALQAAGSGRRYLDPTIASELVTSRGTTRKLSPRERQILKLMADGAQNAGIAWELGISTETVKAHVSNVLDKLDVESRTHAVADAIREGIIE